MSRIRSGEFNIGAVVAFLAIAVPLSSCLAASSTSVSLTIEASSTQISESGTVCFPVPECDAIEADFEAGGRPLSMSLVKTAYIRDQRIAVFRANEEVPEAGEIQVTLRFEGATGPACTDAGPLSRTCSEVLTGYGDLFSSGPPSGPGSVTRCQSLNDCASAGADILLIVGHAIVRSAYVDSISMHWAQTTGLNVAIIDVARISAYSPVMVRDFIKTLYNTLSAEHFGDGHLGFVILLGDAYEDDNTTRMIPDYDGYGGDAEASDHFYACIRGDDEFEDVMIGRIPVGNELELLYYYEKLRSYTPLPAEDWTKSFLFAGGCFFALKEDYVNLFDSLAVYLPPDVRDSRYFRYDFPQTDPGDALAIQAMVDSLEAGHLFVMYCGHADRWNWGGRFERVFGSSFIAGLDNADRLPIVLSIACYSGWFDNTEITYSDGGVDCFAERLLVNEGGGAVACLASSRDAGGGASTQFTSEIIRAAYVNGSTFLGELMLEAKTRHLCRLGNIEYVRQFNLFGDPCLNFVLNEYPAALPDLVLRPYHIDVSPEFIKNGDMVTVAAEVWNAGGTGVAEFEVALYNGDPTAGGELLDTETLTDFWGWEKRTVEFDISNAPGGVLDIYLIADHIQVIEESDEVNNTASVTTYVYPCQSGFPVKIGEDVKGKVIADLDADEDLDILVTSGGSLAQALTFDGNTMWIRDNLGAEEWFENIEPAACDLNGDGATEVILTSKSALYVLEGATGNTIWQRFTDNASVSPVVADLDHDGSFEVLLATYNFMSAKMYAFNTQGGYRWIYSLPGTFGAITSLVCGDFDQDGYLEVLMAGAGATSNLRCFSCSDDPDEQPHSLWTAELTAQGVTSAVGADIERDGDLEIIAASGNTVYVLNAMTGQIDDSVDLPQPVTDLSIADTDNDEVLEILCTSEMGYLYRIDGLEVVVEKNLGGTPVGAPVTTDLDADGTTEIICSLREGEISISTATGGDYMAPVPIRDMCHATPLVGDIDLDGRIEIFAGSVDSVLFALDLGIQGGRSEWPCAGASGIRMGMYAQPFTGMFTDDFVLYGRVDIVGDVVIDEGSQLTIERGTDIRMVSQDIYGGGASAQMCEIFVRGDLVCRGTALHPVTLTGLAYPDKPGTWMGIMVEDVGTATISRTIISNAVTGIDCRNSNVYLSESKVCNCIMAIKADGTSPVIDSNELCHNTYAVSANGGSPVLVGNNMDENSYAGVVMSDGCTAVLDRNVIKNTTSGSGLACYNSNPTILPGNKFESNALNGIYLGTSSPVIDSCYVAYNGECGIKVAMSSSPVISKTSIVGNKFGIGVYNNSDPVLGDDAGGIGGLNDIRDNQFLAIKNYTANTLRAQMNWWGTDVPDPGMFMGPVDYTLWLTTAPAGVGDIDVVDYNLFNMYPNPFVHELNLSFAITSRDVPLEVSVYDVRGKLVTKILSADEPGMVHVAWDGTDSHGRRVASGTYLVAVRSPKNYMTRKVVVLR
jgi:parallel beta-helix repeat protein